MIRLKDAELEEVYRIAVNLELDIEFIKLVKAEMERRGLNSEKHSPVELNGAKKP